MKSISKSPVKESNISKSDDKVKIIIRLRPILKDEDLNPFVTLQDDHTLKILRPGNYSYMKFSNILSSEAKQDQMFELIKQSVNSSLNGVNNTIFAYGQTGAGKTYSIIGDYSHLDSRDNLQYYLKGPQKGVLSRSLQQIFNQTKNKKDNGKILISFIQIYNQKIYDLINPGNVNPLQIRQSKQGQIQIQQMLKQEVKNIDQAFSLVSIGLKNRVTGSTHANSKSSRSHSIFQITYEKNVRVGNCYQVKSSSLKIVDLAGSQKYKIPMDLSPSERQARVQQLRYINGSLSCLGHCISALIEKSRTHIPFRDSKLTRILSDSLVGPGKMKFIVCISPSVSASAETFSTLQFASRAKKAILDRTPKHSLSKKSSMSQQFSILKEQLQRQHELRIETQNQLKDLDLRLSELEKQNKLLRMQNQQLKLRGHAGNRNFNPKVSIGQQASNLLKLSVFKQNKQLMNKNIEHLKPSPPIKKMTTLQQKRQKFQKRIQTFIQKQSPTNSVKMPAEYSFGKVQYSFQPQPRHASESDEEQQQQSSYQQQYESNQQQQTFELYQDQSFFRSQVNDSMTNFIQKTCKNMNMKCYGQLRDDMIRAKKQLKYFQQKDNYLEGLKGSTKYSK